ncbi:MAG: alpha/beta fold hydrolase [Alphaproteobacteria bacterium]
MHVFQSGPVEIVYRDLGEGSPVLLIHGFASNMIVNWEFTGWLRTLTEAGHRVVVFDVRGHGKSGKLYEAHYYRPACMAEDAVNLLDHLEIEKAHIIGYSMGARIAAFLARDRPDRARSLVFGGMASGLVEGIGGEEEIISALLADSLDEVVSEVGRAFRRFAVRTGGDLHALAACMGGQRENLAPHELTQITAPTLVAVGTDDEVAGSPSRLAAMMENAQVVPIPNRDHLMATGDRVFKDSVVSFLDALD